MAGLIQSCHVVCLPTYREGLPKTLLEAAASRRAMIASDIPGCREVVTHRVNGLLVAPREVQPLVKAMLELGEDAVLRRRCGSAARAKAEAVLSVEDVVSHTFRVYQTLWPE
jgi:glycosyltransferase involved in cell wall biosynthesis